MKASDCDESLVEYVCVSMARQKSNQKENPRVQPEVASKLQLRVFFRTACVLEDLHIISSRAGPVFLLIVYQPCPTLTVNIGRHPLLIEMELVQTIIPDVLDAVCTKTDSASCACAHYSALRRSAGVLYVCVCVCVCL